MTEQIESVGLTADELAEIDQRCAAIMQGGSRVDSHDLAWACSDIRVLLAENERLQTLLVDESTIVAESYAAAGCHPHDDDALPDVIEGLVSAISHLRERQSEAITAKREADAQIERLKSYENDEIDSLRANVNDMGTEIANLTTANELLENKLQTALGHREADSREDWQASRTVLQPSTEKVESEP